MYPRSRRAGAGHSHLMALNEADTRAKLIDPALRECGWTEDLVFREQTAGAIVLDGKRPRQLPGRVDYLLRVRVNPGTQPVALALIEAKAENKPPWSRARTGSKLCAPVQRALRSFPATATSTFFTIRRPDRPRARSQSLSSPILTCCARNGRRRRRSISSFPAARALLTPYRGGEGTRRYYQDAAIRAVFEKVARGEKRALLTLATGAGKAFIAAQMLRRLFDAGMARRALFVCDRDELRTQATTALSNLFGGEAAKVGRDSEGGNAALQCADLNRHLPQPWRRQS